MLETILFITIAAIMVEVSVHFFGADRYTTWMVLVLYRAVEIERKIDKISRRSE